MSRLLTTLIAGVCVATVATQAIAAGVLWWHGRLTPAALVEVRDALDGAPRSSGASVEPGREAASGDDEPTEPTPTYEEVLERRALAGLELADRETQLRSAAKAVLAEAAAVEAGRAALAADRAAFAAELAEVRRELTGEAVEQTRDLLKGLGPKKSVGYLMTLPDDAVVTVLRGLDARTAAKILGEFAGGTEQERAKGAAAFAALHAGEPERSAVDDAAAP